MFIWKIRRIVKVRVEQALAYFKRRRDAMQLMEEDAAIWALEKQIPKMPIKDNDKVVYLLDAMTVIHGSLTVLTLVRKVAVT